MTPHNIAKRFRAMQSCIVPQPGSSLMFYLKTFWKLFLFFDVVEEWLYQLYNFICCKFIVYILIQVIQSGEAWFSKTEGIPKKIKGEKNRRKFEKETKRIKKKLMLLKATDKQHYNEKIWKDQDRKKLQRVIGWQQVWMLFFELAHVKGTFCGFQESVLR